MDKYETKDMTGSMFRNETIQNPKAPLWKGQVKVDGKLYDVAGWERELKSGKTILSLSIQEPYKRREGGQDAPRSAPKSPDGSEYRPEDQDDGLPF